MKKKLLTILVCSLLVSNTTAVTLNTKTVQASENQFIVQEGEYPDPNDYEDTPSPLWSYTLTTSEGLIVSKSGLATGSAYIVGYSNVKRISSYMFLQYYNTTDRCYEGVSGASWSKMVDDDANELEYQYQLTKRGKYRIKMVHYVYSNDGNSETIITYSGEETY